MEKVHRQYLSIKWSITSPEIPDPENLDYNSYFTNGQSEARGDEVCPRITQEVCATAGNKIPRVLPPKLVF